MIQEYTEEHRYLLAKKKVDKIKGFYIHLAVYIVVNIFISAMVFYGLTNEEDMSFLEVLSHFGLYSTWFFWGIGVAFHWMGVFGSRLFFSKNWEAQKMKEYLEEHSGHRE